ncbi:MAG: UDP-2,3-diacylglucosamine diphosphatase [Halobacteriota archaeon]|nr:UDP-2,3-diacylglucosamine diphosphatase [Halobacteriota archaeon]
MINEVTENEKRFVVISDLHFGYRDASLTDKGTVDAFLGELEELDGIDELILLGDVFDFWVARPYDAINNSKLFFSGLRDFILEKDSETKIVYIFGNHDPQVCPGDLSEMAVNGVWGRLLRGVKCEAYPEYVKSVNDNVFHFIHGHHFDRLQLIDPSFGVKLTIPKTINGISSMANRVFRYMSVKEQYQTILKFMEDNRMKTDFFIYGHTHRAGSYSEIGKVVAINSGSWVEGHWKSRRKVQSNTYVVIDDEITIKSLGEKTISRLNIN